MFQVILLPISLRTLELLLEMLQKSGVKITPAEMGVTGCSLDCEHATLDVKERHVESTTAEIVDHDVALFLGLASAEAIGYGSGRGLVDDA